MSSEYPNEYPNDVPHDVEVSVRIVTYNQAGYIREAIDGALNQQVDFSYEIVIGEDDSNDGTREICIEYANKYPDIIRLFLRKESDKIYIDGRKTGRYNSIETAKACRGHYVALLEGDDYWIDRRKLQMQRDHLEQNENCKMCATRALVKFEGLAEGADRISVRSGSGGVLNCSDFIYGRIVNLCTVMVRREDKGESTDWGLPYYWGDRTRMLSATAGGGTCYVLTPIMAVYRVHGKGLWSSGGRDPVDTNVKMANYFKAFQQAFPLVEARAVDSAIKFHKFRVLRFSKRWGKACCYLVFHLRPIFSYRRNSRSLKSIH
jgi:glycosyltransferase involved in cell wall biosynthesis